jgi:sulfur carrier protein
MTLTINGNTDSVDRDQLSVIELLAMKDVEMPDMVSVQLNGEILERAAFDSTYVAEGDEVEFLYFMGGGASRRGSSWA